MNNNCDIYDVGQFLDELVDIDLEWFDENPNSLSQNDLSLDLVDFNFTDEENNDETIYEHNFESACMSESPKSTFVDPEFEQQLECFHTRARRLNSEQESSLLIQELLKPSVLGEKIPVITILPDVLRVEKSMPSISFQDKYEEMEFNFEKLRCRLWSFTLKDLEFFDFIEDHNFDILALSLTQYSLPQEIQYYKTLQGFRNYNSELRQALLQSACTELAMIALLRPSSLKTKTWLMQSPKGNYKEISFRSLFRNFRNNLVNLFCNVLTALPEEWSHDWRLLLLLQALALHWPKRDQLSEEQQSIVEKDFYFYLHLLKQYLSKVKMVANINSALIGIQDLLQQIQHLAHLLRVEAYAGGKVTKMYRNYASKLLIELYGGLKGKTKRSYLKN